MKMLSVEDSLDKRCM